MFQVAAAFFNLLIYFPCALLAGALARRGRRQLPLLVVLFAASPLLVENVTYTWTKLFPGLYILLGTWLYLRGFQKQDAFRIVAAFASLCVGMLIHYSAGPYLLFFALHYAWIWRGRKWKWVEPLAIAGVCVLILASWLGWSAWFYGWHTTVSSNTTVMGSESLSFGGNLQKIATNIISTLIPHPLHVSRNDFDKALYQPNAMGYLRDYWFLVYQPTVPEGIGLVGGLTVVYLLVRKLRASIIARPAHFLGGIHRCLYPRRNCRARRGFGYGGRTHLSFAAVHAGRNISGGEFSVAVALAAGSDRRFRGFRFLFRYFSSHPRGESLFPAAICRDDAVAAFERSAA